MAGRVPFDPTRRVSQAGTFAPNLPGNFGMAEIEAKARQGQAIAQVADTGAQILGEFAAKHKRQEMAADAAAFDAFKTKRFSEADLDASQTGDPDRIKAIYEQAETDLRDYATGNNPTSGTPNIRWGDHLTNVENSLEGIKGEIEANVNRHRMRISMADTKAKADIQVQTGVDTGNYGLIRQAVDLLRDNGQLTHEQAKSEKQKFYQAADRRRANSVLMEIESMTPDDAEAAYAGFVQSLKTDGHYKHLGADELKQLEATGKKAFWNARNSARREQQYREEQSAARLEGFIADTGKLPTLAELDALNLDPKHRIKVLDQMGETRTATAQAFKDIHQRILSFRPGEADSTDQQVNILLDIHAMPTPLRSPLLAAWKAQTEPGKESIKIGAERIQNFLEKTDFKTGFGDGWSDVEEAQAVAQVLDRYHRWSEAEPRSDEELLNYVNTDPALSYLRETKDVKHFRARTFGNAPSSRPAILRNSQRVLVPEDQYNMLFGGE